MPEDLADKVTVQMRLPADVLKQMRDESERDLIPLSLLVRRSCIRQYRRGDFVPDDGTNRTEMARNIPEYED